MSNGIEVRAPGESVSAIPESALRRLRRTVPQGIGRRTLLRRSLGLGVGMWVAEMVGGSVSYLWANTTGASTRVTIGTFADLAAANPGLPIAKGFPAYVPEARAFVVLVDPLKPFFVPGTDARGDGRAVNVRALSQRCPHLGCRPNPCVADFWFHCPCHQSQYDRLGTKALGTGYGPAPRGMDRFAVEVSAAGVLTIDTTHVTLGPLPVALGQPGLIPPLVPRGCG